MAHAKRDSVIESLAQLVPPGKSGTLTPEIWEECYTTKSVKGTTQSCPLSSLDLSKHSLSGELLSEPTMRLAANKLWLQAANPVFSNLVMVSVEHPVFLNGSMKHVSEDVLCRSLAQAIFIAHTDGDKSKLDQLVKVAKEIPVLLQYNQDAFAAWSAGFQRIQQKKVDAHLEETSPLAHGRWAGRHRSEAYYILENLKGH